MTRRWALAALVAGLLAVVAPVPTAAPAAARTAGSLRLTSQTAWLGATGSFDLRLADHDVTGTDDLDVVVTVHGRVSSRSAFAQGLEGRPRGTTKVVTVPWDDLPVTESGDRLLSMPLPAPGVPTTDLTLPATLRPRAVYPVTVSLRHHGGAVIDRFVTHLVRLVEDPALEPLSVAWVQPLAAPPVVEDGDHRRLSDAEIASLSAVVQAVGADPHLRMTLDVTPETLANLRASGAVDLTPLETAVQDGDQLLATPFVEVDAGALVAAGRSDDLALQRQVGEDVLLATLGDRGDPRTWSATDPLTPAAVARLRALGVTRLVVPERSLEPLDEAVTGGFTLSRPFGLRAGGDEVMQAAAVDAGLAAHFRRNGDQVLAAHQLLADLAVLFLDAPATARGVVVRPPAAWRPDAAFLGTILPAIADVPMLRPVTLDGLFDGVTPLTDGDRAVVRTAAATGPSTTLPTTRLAGAHRALDELVALTGPDGEPVRGGRLSLLVGEGSRLSAADRRQALDSIVARRDGVRARLAMPDRRTFRLTAREGTIPLTLVNGNPFPVRVDLLLSSDKLEFTDVHSGDRSRHVLPGLELEPGTHTMTIPVRARASGDFPLRATMSAPGGATLREGRFTITSTVFSGVGVVLSIGAALFLALWWASNLRKARRRRRLVDTVE